MKIIPALLSILMFASCASGKENTYTGSTPAAPVIRAFLGIPQSDSIDFIRWKLILQDNRYRLHCNYGIGKPNTNGFINGGEKIELSGAWNKEKNIIHLRNGEKSLKIAELNPSLLHFLETDNSLLVGNGGWSYTLNNTSPALTEQVTIIAKQPVLKDSLAFHGRTPCNIPGLIPAGKDCYKLKWYVILYPNTDKNGPGTYRIFGTPWREEGGITGNWKITTGKNGQIFYRLDDNKGRFFLNLLKLDENILVFTDAGGKLLVGDEDFSYTLNNRL